MAPLRRYFLFGLHSGEIKIALTGLDLCAPRGDTQNDVPILISLPKGLHWVKDEHILQPGRLS